MKNKIHFDISQVEETDQRDDGTTGACAHKRKNITMLPMPPPIYYVYLNQFLLCKRSSRNLLTVLLAMGKLKVSKIQPFQFLSSNGTSCIIIIHSQKKNTLS